MHRAGGVMSEITQQRDARRQFRWSVLDSLEMCPAQRACAECDLVEECNGAAKGARGHMRIDDAIGIKQRTSASVWETEMLCLRPKRDDAVYPEFDARMHVADFDCDALARGGNAWVAGMDFGFRNPTVILWACVGDDGVVRIVDERSVSAVRLEEHIAALDASRWPRPVWIGVDPAGRQRNDQTGVSSVTALRCAGYSVRDRRMALSEGVRMVRTRLAPATGGPTLFVHKRCRALIDALARYRYASERTESLTPVKDGSDHAADALRYLVVGLDGVSPAVGRAYW